MMTFKEILKYYPQNGAVFHELSERCKSGYVVPYIGAGLSVFAGMPSWWRLLNELRQMCADRSFPLENPLKAGDEIERQLGPAFLEYMKRQFHHSESDGWWKERLVERDVGHQALSVIPRLFHGPIITSNYDKLIEAVHGFGIEVALPDDVRKLKDTNREVKNLLYKVHGCISKPEGIVFTGRSYDRYYEKDSEHVRILSTYFKRFNLLFLGCSLSLSEGKDRPIELWEKLVNSGQRHFAILPCDRKQCRKRFNELKRINILPIFYPESRHECVKTVLDQLAVEKESVIDVPLYDEMKYPFVGRESLFGEIREKLGGGDGGGIVCLSGTGGIGKTRVACEYARRERGSYEAGVYYFHALSRENTYVEVIRFALSKGLVGEGDGDTDRRVVLSRMSRWMRDNDGWLFILDNVESFSHVEEMLGLFAGIRPYGRRHFLITTRNRKTPAPCIRIRPFTREESEALLSAITRREPDRYSADLAAMMGGLPLAVEQAASYISRSGISYRECVRQIKSKGLMPVIDGGAHSDGTLAVKATYNLSMERITREETKELMYLLSYFAPDNILTDWILGSSRQVEEFPLLRSGLENPGNLKRMIAELASYSLIHERAGRISIHRITQAVVRGSVPDGRWLGTSCRVMGNAFDMKSFDSANSRLDFLQFVPHMQQMFGLCSARTDVTCDGSLGKLYHLYMQGYDQIKEYREALRYLGRTLRLRRRSGDDRELAKTYNCVGVIYQNMGNQQESLRYLKKALSLRKKVFGESSLGEDAVLLARSYNNIGLHYYWTNQYVKAEEYCRQAIDLKEKYGDRFEVAFSYSNLGAVYEMMSQYCNYQAFRYNREAYDIRKTVENPVRLAFSLNNLGVVEMNLCHFNDALVYLNKALELRKAVYRNDRYHPDIAEVSMNIGEVYTNMGRYGKARRFIDRAVDIFRRRLPEQHVLTSKAYSVLAGWYYAQDRFAEALEWYEKSLAIRTTLLMEGDANIDETRRMVANCRKRLSGGSLLD